jgi:uncharacterized protein YbjQ (UPF0145 family)
VRPADSKPAGERVTQMLRQTDAQVFKKYSQMKLRMKREALTKLKRKANESAANGKLTVPIRNVRLMGF